MKKKRTGIQFFRKVLKDLFYEYKAKMRLNKNWNIQFKVEKQKDTYAEVEYTYGDRDFTVKINSEMNETVNSLRDSIIHEFWHILLSPMKDRFERTLDKIEQGKRVDIKRLRKQIKNEDERMVRKFTRIITELERKSRGN
jgi:hypothetical protein